MHHLWLPQVSFLTMSLRGDLSALALKVAAVQLDSDSRPGPLHPACDKAQNAQPSKVALPDT